MAGFEPAISCSQGRRIGQAFLHPESSRSPISAQRESNPHVRHGEAVGYRYIMGTIAVPELSKSREHQVGLEPTSPPYEGGVFAARRTGHSASGPGGARIPVSWASTRRYTVSAISPKLVDDRGIEPRLDGCKPSVLPLSLVTLGCG